MSGDWKPAARRGGLGIHVVTLARLGGPATLPDGKRLLVLLEPDGEDDLRPVVFDGLPTLATFVRQMKPHTVDWNVGADEDAAAMNAALAELVAAAGERTH